MERIIPLVAGSGHTVTIDLPPGLVARHETALDCVRQCAYSHRNPLKTIAADMDVSQSDLSRKLAAHPDDPRRFTLDDLERFLEATGDMSPIYYLIAKYLQDNTTRQTQALAELAALAPQLCALIKQAGLQKPLAP